MPPPQPNDTFYANTFTFSPDGAYMAATGSEEGKSGIVRIWDVAGKRESWRLQGHAENSNRTRPIAFSPDSKTLAAVHDGNIKLWDLATGRRMNDVAAYKESCALLDFSPDGKLLLAGAAQDAVGRNQVRLWQVSSGQEIALPTKDVQSYVFSDNGTTLALAVPFQDHIMICAADTGKIQSKIAFGLSGIIRDNLENLYYAAHQGWGWPFALSPDGKTLVACDRPGQLRRFDTATGKEIPPPGVATDLASTLAFAPDGKKLLAAGQGRVLLHDTAGKAPPLQLLLQPPPAAELVNGTNMPIATCLAFSHDGCRAAAGWNDGTVAVWEAATGKLLWQAHEPDYEAWMQSLAFTSDDNSLVSTNFGYCQVTWWSVQDGRRQRRFELNGDVEHFYPSQLVVSPNALTALYSDRNGGLWREFELASGRFRREIKIQYKPVTFSPDCRFLLIAGQNAYRLLDLHSSAELRSFAFVDMAANSFTSFQDLARFSPSGLVMAGIAGKDVRCWDRDTGTLLATFDGHDGGALTVAFAPDGRTLATSAGDGTILLWPAPPHSASSPAKKLQLPYAKVPAGGKDYDGEPLPAAATARLGLLHFQHGGEVSGLRYTADGKSILVQTVSGEIPSEAWIELALWDAAMGKLTRQIEVTRVPIIAFRGEQQDFGDWTLSDDARFLALSGTPRGRNQPSLMPTLCVKDISTGKTVFQIDDPDKPRMAVRFAPDGKTLLDVGRYSGQLALLDLTTARERKLERDANIPYPWQAVFSPEGESLLVVNNDGTIDWWDLEPAATNVRLPFKTIASTTLPEFAPGSQQFAMLLFTGAGNKPRLVLVEGKSGKIVRDFREQDYWPNQLLLSPDGNLLVAVAQKEQAQLDQKDDKWVWLPSREVVRRWEVATGKELPAIETTNGAVVKFTPNGKILAIAADRQLRLLDATSGRELRRLPLETEIWSAADQSKKKLPPGFGPFAFSPDGKTVAVAAQRTIRQFDVATGKEIGPTPNWQTVFSLAVAKNGQWTAACAPGQVQVWDAATQEMAFSIMPWSAGDKQTVLFTAQALAQDGRLLAVGGSDGKVVLYDMPSAKRLRLFPCHEGPITSLVFLPDENVLVTCDIDGNVAYWEAASGAPVRKQVQPGAASQKNRWTVKENTQGFLHAWCAASAVRYSNWPALTPDGRLLTALDMPARMLVHAGPKMRALASRPWNESMITAAKGGKLLVLTESWPWGWPMNNDAISRLLDLESDRELRAFANSGPVTACCFSPDHTLLAAGDKKGLRIWDVGTGTVLAEFNGHRGIVTALAFSLDGATLVSAGFDGTLLVWDVAALLARPVSKDLTAGELTNLWEQLAGQDAAAAGEAMRRLAEHPGQAAALFRGKLKPATSPPKEFIAKLVADLDSAQPKVRANATWELEKLAETTEPALRACLAANPTLEQRTRADNLLTRLAEPLTDRDKLRALRAVEILEVLATPEATELLRTLANGADGAYVTRDARAALRRLTKSH